MRNDVDLNDLFGLAPADGPSPAAWESARRELDSVIPPAHDVAVGSPQRRGGWFGPSKRLELIVVALLVVGGTAAFAGVRLLDNSPSTTKPLPGKAWALSCVASWNGPSSAPARQLVAGTEPLAPADTSKGMIQRQIAAAGTPVSASYFFYPPSAGGPKTCDASPVITFKKGATTSTFVFSSLSNPYAETSLGDRHLDTSRLATTTVLANGMLSTNIQPPATSGAWGGHLTFKIHMISTRIPIHGNQTCATYEVTVNRPARVGSYGSDSATVLFKAGTAQPGTDTLQTSYPVTPSTPLRAQTCFPWQGHAHDPLTEFPNFTHPDRRITRIEAVDAANTVENVFINLVFKVVPANQSATHPTKWVLVSQGGNQKIY